MSLDCPLDLARKLITWRPDAPRRTGRPTLKSIIEEETELVSPEKKICWQACQIEEWKEDFVNASPNGWIKTRQD